MTMPGRKRRLLPEPVIADHVVVGAMRSSYSRLVIILLTGSIAIMMTGVGIVMPVFARRLDQLGGGVEALGWMTMAFAGAQFLAAPVMGTLADRIGRRPLILLALAVFTAANLGYLWAPNIAIFIVLRGVAGALTAGLSPAAMGIVADTVPSRERARWIGILMGGYSLGLIFGPLIGGVLYDALGFAAPFVTSAGTGALALVAAAIVVPETRTATARKRDRLRERYEAAMLNRVPQTRQAPSLKTTLPKPFSIFVTLLAIELVGTFAFTFIEPQMIFYVYDQLGWTTVQFGLVVAVYGTAMFAGQMTLGQLSDRFGRRPVITGGILLNSMLYLGLAVVTYFPLIMVVAALAGLGSALIAPALGAFLLDITDERYRSRVMGIRNSALSLGGVLGPLLVVFATRITDSQGVFIMAGGVVVLSALFALALLREPDERRQLTHISATGEDPERLATAHAVLHGLVLYASERRSQTPISR